MCNHGNNRLTDRQCRFAYRAVVVGPSRAYREVYKPKEGTAPATVARRAQAMTSRPAVAAMMASCREQLREESWVEAHQVIRELSTIAFSCLPDILTALQFCDAPNIREALANLSDEQRSAIARLNTRDGKLVEIRLHDKLNALNQLARILDLFHGLSPHPVDPVKTLVQQIRANGGSLPGDPADS